MILKIQKDLYIVPKIAFVSINVRRNPSTGSGRTGQTKALSFKTEGRLRMVRHLLLLLHL